jgi:uncharacterized membrane protein HdeD (DUF308 family)
MFVGGDQVFAALARNWWAVALRGLFAILFGLVAWIWPGATVLVLIILFGAYALVDGILEIWAAIRAETGATNRWAVLFEGIVSVIAGIIALVWPGLSALAILYIIAAWAIITGIFEIVAAIQLRQAISNEWLLGLSGVASLIFGIVIAIFPGSGVLAITWLIGVYAIIFGIILIGLAFRLRSMHERAGRTTSGYAD